MFSKSVTVVLGLGNNPDYLKPFLEEAQHDWKLYGCNYRAQESTRERMLSLLSKWTVKLEI